MWYEKFATLFSVFFAKLEVVANKSLRDKEKNVTIIYIKLCIFGGFFTTIKYSVSSLFSLFFF